MEHYERLFNGVNRSKILYSLPFPSLLFSLRQKAIALTLATFSVTEIFVSNWRLFIVISPIFCFVLNHRQAENETVDETTDIAKEGWRVAN